MNMSNQFFILIDKRDSEKFRKFRLGKFNQDIKKILDKSSTQFIWGLHKAKVSSSIWSKLKKNDVVFFTIPNDNFKICGKLLKKSKNTKLSSVMYRNDLNAKNVEYFLFFKSLENNQISFHELIHNAVSKISVPIAGIYEIKKSYYDKSSKKTKPKQLSLTKIPKGPAAKNKSEVWRFLRDTKDVKKLKSLYDGKCQICGTTFEIGKNRYYSEVHHYWPLEQHGDDDATNMIVVCPNHHTKFDYNLIAIDRDGTHILDKNGRRNNEKISFKKSHVLAQKNIDHQLE